MDANKCKMVFDDNEEEYEEFYDWSKLEAELAGRQPCAGCNTMPDAVCTKWHDVAMVRGHKQSMLLCISTSLSCATCIKFAIQNSFSMYGMA